MFEQRSRVPLAEHNLSSRLFPTLGETLEQSPQSPDWIGTDRIYNVEEFHNVKTPFPAFVFCDERLRALEPLGEIVLGQARFFADFSHQYAEGALVSAVD